MKDGIYKSGVALYLVKDKKIAVQISGSWYKTNSGFMVGAEWKEDLPAETIAEFDSVYDKLPNW